MIDPKSTTTTSTTATRTITTATADENHHLFMLHDVLELSRPSSSPRPNYSNSSDSNTSSILLPGVFVIYDSNTEQALPTTFSTYTIVDGLPLHTFLKEGSNNLYSKCRFYSTELSQWEDHLLKEEEEQIEWRRYLISDGKLDITYSNSTSPLINLLYPGCTLQGRYSPYHTMRVQVKGKARYYLFSPDQVITSLHIFPSLHSSAYQSQVDFYSAWKNDKEDDDGDDSIKRLSKVDAMVSDVESGQVLYIPPGWMVLSEAQETLSITLDILSVSKVQMYQLEALALPLPFSTTTTTEFVSSHHSESIAASRIIRTQVFLVHVLSRIHGIKTIKQYGRKLYTTRYQSLLPENSLEIRQSNFTCYKHGSDKDDDLYRREIEMIEKEDRLQMENIASATAERFNKIGTISTSMKWLLLGDYIEQIIGVAWLGGGLHQIVLFLLQCFHMKAKLDIVEEVQGPPVVHLDPK
eukprot:gene4927-5409_t